MMWSRRIGDEVYVYRDGILVYKRWIARGYGIVLEAYGSCRWPDDHLSPLAREMLGGAERFIAEAERTGRQRGATP